MRSLSLEDFPFYRERLESRDRPEPWTLDDLESFARRTGDPFAGRVRNDIRPRLALQLEATGEPPVWLGLAPGEADRFAAGLERIWSRWGLERGETIALFDYGSSPLVLLASASYGAYLRRGAADRLGAVAICNDGVATLAGRMVEVLDRVRPAALVARRDVLVPLTEELRTTGRDLSRLRWVGVSDPEGAARREDLEGFAREWRVSLHRFLRADAVPFVSGDCPVCGLFHVDRRLYRVETVGDGAVAVTSRFGRTCPGVRYVVDPARLVPPGCEGEPGASRLEVP